MTPHLLGPEEAVGKVAARLSHSWAERVCAEVDGTVEAPIEIGLRPGVDGNAAVLRVGLTAWSDWRIAWRAADLDDVPGVALLESEIGVAGTRTSEPSLLRVTGLDAGLRLLEHVRASGLDVDIARARRTAARLRDAGVAPDVANLRAVLRLVDTDVDVMFEAIAWFDEHPDLGGWTARALPVPGMHTKWLAANGGLLRRLVGRDVSAEARPRLTVVHLTYVDPDYLATGGRCHDSWTTGDVNQLAYRPQVVLVVENRDCRLWFPEFPGTVVVEGSGKAAASSLAGIEWLTGAEHVVYWGDIDADGFAILNALRAEFAQRGIVVDSILMDATALHRYAHLGVDHDRHGEPLRPSAQRLPELTAAEDACYAGIATAGDVPFRRIEQERIDIDDAVGALREVVGG